MASSCQYEKCRVPTEGGSELCIFHSPGAKDLEEFKRTLSAQINEVDPAEDRNRRYWFEGYVFPTHVLVGDSQKEWIELSQTIEEDASFRDATFEEGVSFDDVTFKGNAEFSGSTFNGDASFDGATIERYAVFDGATFNGDAWFRGATVKRDAMFFGATIKGRAEFTDATIKGDAWFIGVTIEGFAVFDGATIRGCAMFDGVTIKGPASFDAFDCRSLVLGFNKPRIRGWRHDRCGILICSAYAAVVFWRVAQRIFSRTGMREKADAAFYFERLNRWRVLRRSKKDDKAPKVQRWWTNWVIRPGYWFLFLLDLLFVRWTTAYGASVARLFSTWFVVIVGFGITFSMVPRLIEHAGAQVWSLRNWIIGFHYSVTTFATLGLGRIGPGPSRLGMVLTSIEAILGAVLIALAVLVIGRRFMRQS